MKNFASFNNALARVKEPDVNKELRKALNVASAIASAGTSVPSRYASLYAAVQMTKYGEDGAPSDVTDADRQSIPDSVVTEAKKMFEKLEAERLHVIESGKSAALPFVVKTTWSGIKISVEVPQRGRLAEVKVGLKGSICDGTVPDVIGVQLNDWQVEVIKGAVSFKLSSLVTPVCPSSGQLIACVFARVESPLANRTFAQIGISEGGFSGFKRKYNYLADENSSNPGQITRDLIPATVTQRLLKGDDLSLTGDEVLDMLQALKDTGVNIIGDGGSIAVNRTGLYNPFANYQEFQVATSFNFEDLIPSLDQVINSLPTA